MNSSGTLQTVIMAVLLGFGLYPSLVLADDTWDNGGVGGNWSTNENWLDDTKPGNPETGVVYFSNDGLGATNVVDQDWVVKNLRFKNSSATQSHTTDLDGHRLTVWTELTSGYDVSNSTVVIRSGTLQLGAPGYGCSLYVGRYVAVNPLHNISLAIHGVLDITNITTVQIGDGPTGGCVDGMLDLRDATINTLSSPNTMRIGTLYMLNRGDGDATIRFPTSLQKLETTGHMYVGYYGAGHDDGGLATLDFGAGSALTEWRAGGSLRLGDNSSSASILNLPEGVAIYVGSPGSPSTLCVGNHSGRYGTASHAELVVSNGILEAYLTELKVGTAHDQGEGCGTGIMDVASCAVQIGDEPNKIKGVTTFQVGKGDTALGVLRLPPEITEIEVGEFLLGHGSKACGAVGHGYLDLGSNSQLRALTVTDGYYLGTECGSGHCGYDDAGSFVESWPTGLTLTIGEPGAPAPMHIGTGGDNTYTLDNTGDVTLVNGVLAGHLSELKVGSGGMTDIMRGYPVGILDLTASAVHVGASNSLIVPRLIVGGADDPLDGSVFNGYPYISAKGTLRLPASVTNLLAGYVEIGAGAGYYYSWQGCDGTLEFAPGSQLNRFEVTNAFYLGTQGATSGRIVGVPTNGVQFVVGSPDNRVPMIVGHRMTGHASYAKYGDGRLVLTNANFTGYLTDLLVGVSENDKTYGQAYGLVDLEASTLAVLDVDGLTRIGYSMNTGNYKTEGCLKLPAGPARTGVLEVGGTNSTAKSRGVLDLHGTHYSVSTRLLVNLTGSISNHLTGEAGGIDIASSDTNDFVVASGGVVHLAYEGDPTDPQVPYWGLRMAGDQRTHFNWLHGQGRLTWDTAGLSAGNLRRFGIHYSASRDHTFVGLREPIGSLLIVY